MVVQLVLGDQGAMLGIRQGYPSRPTPALEGSNLELPNGRHVAQMGQFVNAWNSQQGIQTKILAENSRCARIGLMWLAVPAPVGTSCGSATLFEKLRTTINGAPRQIAIMTILDKQSKRDTVNVGMFLQETPSGSTKIRKHQVDKKNPETPTGSKKESGNATSLCVTHFSSKTQDMDGSLAEADLVTLNSAISTVAALLGVRW